jgi:hypothetical protein
VTIVVNPGGEVRCIYSETVDLSSLGSLSSRRASHVEPDANGRWWADLSPVNGPKLGPFGRRAEALAAKQHWLETNWLTAPKG